MARLVQTTSNHRSFCSRDSCRFYWYFSFDDWRQARTDQGQAHKILTKIHGNLLEHRDLYRVQALRKTLAAEDALAFALRNEFLWGDADNSSIFGLIFDEPFVPSRLVDLERLVRSELLANFPELQAKLDFYNNLMQNQFANNGKMLDIATDVQIDLFRSSGVIFPQGDTTLSGEQEPRSGIEQRSRDLATAPYLDMSQQELREYDVLGRIGGEEVLVDRAGRVEEGQPGRRSGATG